MLNKLLQTDLNSLLEAVNQVIYLYSSKASKKDFDKAMQILIECENNYEANQYVLVEPE